MFSAKLTLLALALSVSAAPLQKRIAQVISDSTTQWEAACRTASNNSPQCNTISVNAFSTLLAAAGPCDQQNAADTMVDFAKTLSGDTSEVVRLAQIFAQQPRNSPTSLSVPYCQSAPRNAELNGLFQCQFASTNKETFVSSPSNLKIGDAGTIPFGLSAPLNPAGSCPANPSGPVPDGQQLVQIVGSGSSGVTGKANGSGVATKTQVAAPAATSVAASDNSASGDDDDCADVTVTVEPTATAAATSSASPAKATSASAAGDFRAKNAQDAQALNAKFAALSKSDKCTDGTNACINGQFAQCVSGAFVTTSCGPTTQCFALPLVNSAGTSITCTTQADAEARIGGSVTGN